MIMREEEKISPLPEWVKLLRQLSREAEAKDFSSHEAPHQAKA